jgi:cell division transport system permease protein
MAQSFEQYQRRRLISSYFSVVFSIFLVLFLLGALGLFVINSEKISNDFKENIPMTVCSLKMMRMIRFVNAFDTELKNSKFIKSFDFVHKDRSG